MTTQLQRDNFRTYLEIEAIKLGTEDQYARWRDGLLPDDELLHIARAELYKVMGPFIRREKLRSGKAYQLIHHGLPTCLKGGTTDDVIFETTDVCELEPPEWDTFTRISQATEAIKVHPWLAVSEGRVETLLSSHWATCSKCQREHVVSSVSVMIDWAGRILCREYAL